MKKERAEKFKKFLKDRGYSSAGISSRVDRIRFAEKVLQADLDDVVSDDEEMYKAILHIEKHDDDHRNVQNALRRYYEFRRGSVFPTKNQYKKIRETKNDVTSNVFFNPKIKISILEKNTMDNLHRLSNAITDIESLLTTFEAVLKHQELLNEDNKKHFLPVASNSKEIRVLDFYKGSFALTVLGNVCAAIIVMFIQEVYKKQNPDRPKAIDINLYNSIIIINDNDINNLPDNSTLRNFITIKDNGNSGTIDAKQIVADVIKRTKPDEDLEQSMKRLFNSLKEKGIVTNEYYSYDSYGYKKVLQSADKVIGSIIDEHI